MSVSKRKVQRPTQRKSTYWISADFFSRRRQFSAASFSSKISFFLRIDPIFRFGSVINNEEDWDNTAPGSKATLASDRFEYDCNWLRRFLTNLSTSTSKT